MSIKHFYQPDTDIKLLSAEAARQVVSNLFQIPARQLMSRTRSTASIALARQSAMYLCHVVASISLSETARLFHRDRTTVSHACNIIEDKRDSPYFDELIELAEIRFRRELERIEISTALDTNLDHLTSFPKAPQFKAVPVMTSGRNVLKLLERQNIRPGIKCKKPSLPSWRNTWL